MVSDGSGSDLARRMFDAVLSDAAPAIRTMPRADLVALVEAASAEGCAESTRAKLIEVARTTDAVAANWFHCDGVGCVGRQAGRKNQTFQTAYDKAMCERFGVPFAQARSGFVVHIVNDGGR